MRETIDLSDVEISLVDAGESSLEADVKTRHGSARLCIDLSSENEVGVRATLPSGNEYTSGIASWAADGIDLETGDGVASILRLEAGEHHPTRFH